MNPIVHPCGLFLDGSPIVPHGCLRMDLTGCGAPAVHEADVAAIFSWLGAVLKVEQCRKDDYMRMEHRVRSRSAGRPGVVEERMVAGAGETPAGVGRNMLLDINRAEISRLKSLTGIGEHYAKKIVEGRPYHHREELLTKEILPEYIYGRIMDRLMASQS